MASVGVISCLFIYICIVHFAKGNECVTYDFEYDVDSHFVNNTKKCVEYSAAFGPNIWNVGNYSAIRIENLKPHVNSNSFIAPFNIMYCGSTFTFPMTAGGTFYVNIYINITFYEGDYLKLQTWQAVSNGDDILVDEVIILDVTIPGWRTITINVKGTGNKSFDGYITFLGLQSPRARVYMDSFRYIPPGLDADSCPIYEDTIKSAALPATETTTEYITDILVETTLPPTAITENTFLTDTKTTETTVKHTNITDITIFTESDECITYNFENDVDSHFFNNTGLCTDLEVAPWSLKRYSEIWIESPHANSFSFVSPSSFLSCGSTFIFPMRAGGILEVYVFIQSNYMTDQILLMARQAVPSGNDFTVGSAFVSASDPNFRNGWQTLVIEVYGTDKFEGYISVLGMQSAKSIVLIDSFRYIPPKSDAICTIYEDRVESTTPPIVETTSELTTLPTTETTSETTTDLDIVTTTQKPAIEECIIINFENDDFDDNFSNDNSLCTGHSSWQLGNYTSIDIKSPDPNSTVFMAPHEFISCISSFVFKMEPNGIIEANVFMEPAQTLDYIIIMAQRVMNMGADTFAGSIQYHPENEDFVPGWNVIRFSILEQTSFDGYLIFIGRGEVNSKVLVDSIRYIPPLTPAEDASCILY